MVISDRETAPSEPAVTSTSAVTARATVTCAAKHHNYRQGASANRATSSFDRNGRFVEWAPGMDLGEAYRTGDDTGTTPGRLPCRWCRDEGLSGRWTDAQEGCDRASQGQSPTNFQQNLITRKHKNRHRIRKQESACARNACRKQRKVITCTRIDNKDARPPSPSEPCPHQRRVPGCPGACSSLPRNPKARCRGRSGQAPSLCTTRAVCIAAPRCRGLEPPRTRQQRPVRLPCDRI